MKRNEQNLSYENKIDLHVGELHFSMIRFGTETKDNFDNRGVADHTNNVCREDLVMKEVLEEVVATEIR